MAAPLQVAQLVLGEMLYTVIMAGNKETWLRRGSGHIFDIF